jgi:hypothetical protein
VVDELILSGKLNCEYQQQEGQNPGKTRAQIEPGARAKKSAHYCEEGSQPGQEQTRGREADMERRSF